MKNLHLVMELAERALALNSDDFEVSVNIGPKTTGVYPEGGNVIAVSNETLSKKDIDEIINAIKKERDNA